MLDETKLISYYSNGDTLEIISKNLNIDIEDLKSYLVNFSKSSREGKTFTTDFKVLVATRDSNGVKRKSISEELKINPNTVRKICETHGTSVKNTIDEDPTKYTTISGEFDSKKCVGCNSHKVKEVESNTFYCLDCGGEYIFKPDCVLKINWEHIK